MKQKDIQLGGVYVAKVSGRLTRVRVDAPYWTGSRWHGWSGTNLETGRTIRIQTAARLRGPAR